MAGRVGLVVGLLGVGAALMWGGEAVLRPAELEGLPFRVEQWAFWSMTLAALVFGYTSFEVLYREPVARRIGTLPIPSDALFWWKVIAVYRVHLPLALVPALSGVSLLQHGHTAAWLTGVGAAVGALVWGLAAAIYAHVWAGTSLLDGGSDLKGYLAQGFGPPETAFLFYSPAMALTAALSIGMLCDLALGTALDKGLWKPFQTIAGGFTVGALVAIWAARRRFVAGWHRIAPKFEDAEVLPPWREGELPRTYAGERLGARLSVSARRLWRRDLIQYRRRYRIVVPMLVVVSLVLFWWGAGTVAEAGGGLRLALATVAVAVVAFVPVFRVAGPELGARFDARALPVDPADERRVQWLLAATEWVPLTLASVAACLWASEPIAALVVVAAMAIAFSTVNGLAIPRALHAAPDVGRVSLTVRGSALLAVGLVAVVSGMTDLVARVM